jgi:hypothetical protein
MEKADPIGLGRPCAAHGLILARKFWAGMRSMPAPDGAQKRHFRTNEPKHQKKGLKPET